jgi:NAD(P)-dependent dehydrogenase (short-subunit alcohol dehydrogenase family)
MSLTPIGMEGGMSLEGRSIAVTSGNRGIDKAVALAAAVTGMDLGL